MLVYTSERKGIQAVQVTLTTNLTQKISWERPKRVAASAWEKSSKELSSKQALYRVAGVGVILWTYFRATSGIAGILWPDGGHFFFLCRAEPHHLHLEGLEKVVMAMIVWEGMVWPLAP